MTLGCLQRPCPVPGTTLCALDALSHVIICLLDQILVSTQHVPAVVLATGHNVTAKGHGSPTQGANNLGLWVSDVGAHLMRITEGAMSGPCPK